MSSTSAPKKIREFLVIVPDKPGVWKCARALLNSVPAGDDPAAFDFMGSTIVCKAETKEQVLEQLKNDIYVTSGVWDLKKFAVRIHY
ncbi:hypothetical protein E4U55_005163 [Claviceps digitariae]|nr:hypothetical protein E4U55_005163 [Claviceps digitariae]